MQGQTFFLSLLISYSVLGTSLGFYWGSQQNCPKKENTISVKV